MVRLMDIIRDLCSSVARLRAEKGIRTRQPLPELKVIHPEAEELSRFEDIVKDECNVKRVTWITPVQPAPS